MYPNSGEKGLVKLKMYRGIKDQENRLSKDFASDPGDYGSGEYWTINEEYPKDYGNVISREISMNDVYHIPKKELSKLIEEYRTCKLEDGHTQRHKNAIKLTEMFKKKGYKAVLTKGYEDFEDISICIFK